MKRFLSTFRIGMALFLAVFSSNLLPVATAYATTEGVVETTSQEVCPDTTFTAELGGWVKYDDLSSTSFPVPEKEGYTIDNICYKASNEVVYPGLSETVVSTVKNQNDQIQNLSHVSVHYTKNQTIPMDATAGVTVTPPTCDADGYATVTGLAYATLVGTLDQSVGTHEATFTATTGHHFSNGTATLLVSYTILAQLTGEQCEEPEEPTPLPLPSGIADVCGIGNDTVPLAGTHYTVKTDTGWVQDGNSLTKTVRTITYEAHEGYVFSPAEGWTVSENGMLATYTFTDWGTPCPATAGVVTYSDTCGVSKDTFTVPTTTGVDYKIGGDIVAAGTHPATGTVTVVAVAKAGYTLTAPYTFTHTFTNEECPSNDVTICHRTASYTNPYVEITVNSNAVDGQANEQGNQADHYGEHKGPIFYASIPKHTEWGDIIPPVAPYHTGLNWTAEGQELLRNHCNFPQEVPNVSVDTDACVPRGSENGTFTVTVMNPNENDATFMVDVEGDEMIAVIEGKTSHTFTFTGYAAGTYDVHVYQNTEKKAEVSGMVTPLVTPSAGYDWKKIASTTVELEECPPQVVVATAPSFLNPTCEISTGRVIIPVEAGVTYMINGEVKAAGTYHYPASSSVTVTVQAMNADYVLDTEATTSWQNTFAAVPTNCVLGTTTGGGLGQGQLLGATTFAAALPSTLPETGGLALPNPLLSLIAGFFTYLFLSRRNRKAEA